MSSPQALTLVLLALLAAPSPTPAQPAPPPVRVHFPHPGYYRPGQYTPVVVSTNLPSAPATPVELRGDGLMMTTVTVPASGTVTVPLLVLDRPDGARWALSGVGERSIEGSLTRLEPDEVLVAVPDAADDGLAVAAALFPGKRLVPLPVSSVSPPPVYPAVRAWEVLDAVVRDAPPHDLELWTLLAAGTSVIVRTEGRPDNQWPWRRVAGAWVLQPPLAGPKGAVYPPAYQPAHALRPGQPATLRRRLVFIGAVVSILALALTLWRSRWAAAAVVALCAAAAAALAAWGGPGAIVPRRATGLVAVEDGASRLVQLDEYTYVKTLSRQQASHPWTPYFSRPVLFSFRHARQVDLRLHVDGGHQYFTWSAQPGAPMAFLSRTVSPGMSNVTPADATSPLRDLARQGYLGPGDTLGPDVWWFAPDVEPTVWDELWPSLVVRRGEAPPA